MCRPLCAVGFFAGKIKEEKREAKISKISKTNQKRSNVRKNSDILMDNERKNPAACDKIKAERFLDEIFAAGDEKGASVTRARLHVGDLAPKNMDAQAWPFDSQNTSPLILRSLHLQQGYHRRTCRGSGP